MDTNEIESQISSTYQYYKDTITTSIGKEILEDFKKINVKLSIDTYKESMEKNYMLWWEKFSSSMDISTPKLGAIIFEHPSIYSTNFPWADAYGVSSQYVTKDLFDEYPAEYLEDFYAFGDIYLTPLEPLIKFQNISEDDEWNDLDELAYIFYDTNSYILGDAIEQTFKKSKFYKICAKPFFFNIQEHDTDTRMPLAYFF
ncbi:MAG: hypothetical protein MUC49_03940 [Raineya sp.]|jgi:hypothetical protein|nr:hypothetical protein [Raineya sp.]